MLMHYGCSADRCQHTNAAGAQTPFVNRDASSVKPRIQTPAVAISFGSSNAKTINNENPITFTAPGAFVLTIDTTSCNKKITIDDIKSGGKVFDAAAFKQNTIAGLDNRTIGYNFVFSPNGRLVDSAERGFARRIFY